MPTTPTTREVTGTIRHADGSAWAGATVKFELQRSSYTTTDFFPPDKVTTTTQSDGQFSVELWTNQEGLAPTSYKCSLPNGIYFTFTLTAGSGPIDITTLRAASSPPISNADPIYSVIDARIEIEASARQSADNAEASARASADSSEAATRAAADTAEATARSSADATLQANIDAEATARVSAITSSSTADRARSNHTGTQLASTISDFASAVDARIPVLSVSGRTGAITLSKSDVGLANVDNTSDANKPVSTAQQSALDLKAPLASPALTGMPTAPTAANATSSTQLATTEFVHSLITDLINAAPSALDTLGEIATQLASDESAVAALTTTVSGKLAKASNLSDLTNLLTARANLGVAIGSDVLAYSAQIAAIAALAPSNDDILQRKAGAWTNRSIAQFKADLALAASDISNFNSAVDARVTSAAITSALGYTPENTASKNAASGYAGLDSGSLLNRSQLPVFVGSGASHAIGAVPDPGASAGTTKYLREDGTWVTPPDTNSGGTVTSISMTTPGAIFNTPVAITNPTTTPAIALSLINQSANTVLAGPSTGAATTPAFRSLVAADIPDISATYATLTGTQTLTNKTLTSPTVSGGTINNAVIGGTTPAAASVTTLSVTGTISNSGTLRLNGAGGALALQTSGGTQVQLSSGVMQVASGQFQQLRNAASVSGTVTLNFNNGNVEQITLTGNVTSLTLSNLKDGSEYIVSVVQDATGGRTISWPSTVKWVGGTAPTLTATALARDNFKFWSDGTNLYEINRALDVK